MLFINKRSTKLKEFFFNVVGLFKAVEVCFKTLSLAVAAVFVLAGCGGGGSEESAVTNEPPTDRNISFRIFPSDFFDLGYTENYALSGTLKPFGSENTEVITGRLNAKAVGLVTFNSFQAQSFYMTTNLRSTQVGLLLTGSSTGYYSTDINSIRKLGSQGNGVQTTANSNSVIPLNAKIGSFGPVGEYVNTANYEVLTARWELLDGFSGKAKLCYTYTTVTSEFDSDIVSVSEECQLITTQGKRLSMTIEGTNYEKRYGLKLSGSREE